ncbi:MAG TPA: M28 family peptidase [Azospirillaceae bacterium]|nr:M28 family peptidase [Azospirillaceae bacterium]
MLATNRLRHWLLATALAVLPPAGAALAQSAAPAPAGQEPASQVKVEVSIDRMAEHIRTLASDEFEGRKPGTPGEEKTVAYLVEQFKALGLQPAVNGSYIQDVPLVEITVKDPGRLTVQGRDASKSYEYFTQTMIWTRRLDQAPALDNSEVVFVGHGVVAPEHGWNDYAGVDVRGKTVLVLVNDPGFNTGDPKLFSGPAMTWYGRWPYKYAEAARQGAAGVLIVHEARAAGYPWAITANSNKVPRLHIEPENAGKGLAAIEGWVQQDVAREMFAMAGQDFEDLKLKASQPGFKAVPLDLKLSVAMKTEFRRLKSRNVVGVVPGASRAEEVVLYSAHWDHLGRGNPVNGDDIYNGAVDNAVAVAGMLEVARAYGSAAKKPERSVAFIAFTAEEQGLIGSEYYGRNPVYPAANTVANLNLEMLGTFGPMRDITVIGAGKSELEDYVARWAAANGKVVKPEAFPERGLYYRSDHFSLARVGIPAMWATLGTDSLKHGPEWGKAQQDAYTRLRYHTPADEFTGEIDLTGAAEEVQMQLDIGRLLADGTDWPDWYEGAEFRALRETSRAGR